MRTHKEMLEYNKKHGFGNRWHTKKSFRLIETALYIGEEVLVAFSGSLDNKKVWRIRSRYAFALTNNRLIIAQKKFFSFKTDTKSVEIQTLKNVNFKRDVIRCSLEFNTVSLSFSLRKFRRRGKKVYNAVNSTLGVLRSGIDGASQGIGANTIATQTHSQPRSTADELKKFKELVDLNIISQEEFEKIKNNLLAKYTAPDTI